MTRRVFLHVGAPKSGTTYLQSVMAANRDALARAGTTVVGREHIDLVHAGMVIREDPRLENLPPRAGQAWNRLLEEISAWSGSDAIVSYELLAGATSEQAERALADLAAYEVHVVITARDLARALPSAWQERLKFALTTPLESWQPPPETERRSEWGWRTMDPSGVAERWGSSLPPARVHLVTVPRTGGPDELWRRFAEACGLTGVAVVPPSDRSNKSLGAGAAEVLRRVNERVGPPLEGNREHARWLRDVLAERVLAPLDDEPIAVTDAQYAEAQERYSACRDRLDGAGHTWHGDIEDLAPTRLDGRTPGQVSAEQQLDVAVGAIWSLLLELREARTPQRGPAPPPERARGRDRLVAAAKNVALGAYHRRVLAEQQQLRQRVAHLEATLVESRRLQNQLAMVSDVVGELLLPLDQRDDARLLAAVQHYRQETL